MQHPTVAEYSKQPMGAAIPSLVCLNLFSCNLCLYFILYPFFIFRSLYFSSDPDNIYKSIEGARSLFYIVFVFPHFFIGDQDVLSF